MGVNAVAIRRGSEANGVVTRGGCRSTTCRQNWERGAEGATGPSSAKLVITLPFDPTT